ncbi:MAG: hypothetical protein CMH22_06230 [Methylophaga sp.]|nr:hypothetical protein [Methylophaga sp.]|tara:strand:+ start:39138 stop:39356 length:219 start_codon:yes stop_codon:yes gene_type:complete
MGNYLIHWFIGGGYYYKKEWVYDWDYEVEVKYWNLSEQFFEILWSVTEKEVKQFVKEMAEKYKTDKIWYERI